MVLEETAVEQRSGAADFDFLFGNWKVHNRKLRKRLAGCAEWDEFEGTSVARPVWGGKANMDEFNAIGPSGPIEGMTLRLYDPPTGQWSIYWGHSQSMVLDNPMIGGFRDGRGEFYNQEFHQGRAVYCRFLWSNDSPASCRWEQALSEDGGRTWETNWIMEFTRVPE